MLLWASPLRCEETRNASAGWHVCTVSLRPATEASAMGILPTDEAWSPSLPPALRRMQKYSLVRDLPYVKPLVGLQVESPSYVAARMSSCGGVLPCLSRVSRLARTHHFQTCTRSTSGSLRRGKLTSWDPLEVRHQVVFTYNTIHVFCQVVCWVAFLPATSVAEAASAIVNRSALGWARANQPSATPVIFTVLTHGPASANPPHYDPIRHLRMGVSFGRYSATSAHVVT